jgi:hypothetical protein
MPSKVLSRLYASEDRIDREVAETLRRWQDAKEARGEPRRLNRADQDRRKVTIFELHVTNGRARMNIFEQPHVVVGLKIVASDVGRDEIDKMLGLGHNGGVSAGFRSRLSTREAALTIWVHQVFRESSTDGLDCAIQHVIELFAVHAENIESLVARYAVQSVELVIAAYVESGKPLPRVQLSSSQLNVLVRAGASIEVEFFGIG